MDPLECLFGRGDGHFEPWHAYHKCECKEINQSTCDFLHDTLGLYGDWHDTNGWIISLPLWNALVQYVRWCEEQKTDFKFHIAKVQEGDEYYRQLACAKLTEFGAEE